jgi:LPPG:FO 2-phospho-L-lactate transferase
VITALAGGVGAAKLLQGIVNIFPEEELTVIVNTGDDIELHGLHISPDLDIIMYTLSDQVDPSKGWGIRGDTFCCLDMLRVYGYETWFSLGDRDLATHIYRTHLLKRGLTLSEATDKMRRKLGIKVQILPMTNDKFETHIVTDQGTIHFEEYLVKRAAQDRILNVIYRGADNAKPCPGVLEAIMEADTVVICPSNPIVSIGTILSIKGVEKALRETDGKVVGVSPIVGGAPIKGPADKLMRGLKKDVSACAVAEFYRNFLDVFVIDNADKNEKQNIEKMGIQTVVTRTIMKSLDDRIQLARTVLDSSRREV